MSDKREPSQLTTSEYQSLAGFRFHVRRFFAYSERATEAAGLSPSQYQALLAIRAHDGDQALTISGLAECLFIRTNTAVELVGRMEAANLVDRVRSRVDRRRVEVTLSQNGSELLESLAQSHLEQHREHLPELLRLLELMDIGEA